MPASIASAPKGSPAVLLHMVTPSRLLPELVGQRGVVAIEDGTQRVLVDRMRLLVHADGSLERAAELLPGGTVSSIALPSRLGGGYLFHVNTGGGTEIWRAATWLDKLKPLTHRGEVVNDIVPGFDRIYLRLASNNRVMALDPRSGDVMGLGPLPLASSYGTLAFADGWRAVVDTDLRGPLTTFDAGATWRAVGLTEKSTGVGVIDGNPAVLVHGGRYLIDPHGALTYRTDHPDPHERRVDESDRSRGGDPGAEPKRPSPLGKRPLRAAVEDGWPIAPGVAVVARGGALARVSLRDGAVVALSEDAYPERRSTCHAARLGLHGVGFLCGEHDGPTTIYELDPPLRMKPVLRFEKPRVVAASGNGALVLRGRCADDPAPTDEADARWYCVRSPIGEMREIRVKGFDLGVERVVGLGDGRIAVLVPPRGGSAGALSIISGGTTSTVPLVLPAEPKSAARELKRGMWLDGFEERAPGVLGGWIEAGGPFVGVEIGLDGKVKAGEVRTDAGGAIYGGRFAIALGEGPRAAETYDGGMSWSSFDLPEREDEARAVPTRACGPVGSALPGWVRVGWGDTESVDDMKQAESPSVPYTPFKVSPTITLECDVTTTSTPPLPERAKPAPRAPAGAPHVRVTPPRATRDLPTWWGPFRNTEAPVLAADDFGVDNGATSGEVFLRAYAWGKRGSDWLHNGRWTVRFDDRFDPVGGVRASATTASLWAHDSDAVDAIGNGTYGSSVWRGYIDPSGRSILAAACRGSGCSLYAIAEGQPVLPLRPASGATFPRLVDYGAAVRLGDSWFFLTPVGSYETLGLWRADLGVARQIGTYHQLTPHAPRLVRRATSNGLGLLVTDAPDPGERTGSWFVLPIDLETGTLGEAARLARRDFADVALARCPADQDGWMIDAEPDTATNVEIANAHAQLDKVELRVRVDPGRACIDGLATRSNPFFATDAHAGTAAAKPLTSPPGRKGANDDRPLALAVTEKDSGRRWGLACKLRKR